MPPNSALDDTTETLTFTQTDLDTQDDGRDISKARDILQATNLCGPSRHRSTAPVLVIHGGAGTISRAHVPASKQEEYRKGLRDALTAGYDILKGGGEAMDAAVAAVASLEDCPLFNAAKGAVFNVAGKNELECSLMVTRPPSSHPEIPESRRGMALMLITHLRNPSKAARALYLNPKLAPHAALSGTTAESIAEGLGEELVDDSYYFTEERWRQHRRGLGLPDKPAPTTDNPDLVDDSELDCLPKGTVGAVCLDLRGCIAAVTSTGGKTNKLVGRIGDTPTFGCGYWAEEWLTEGWFRRIWRRLRGKGDLQAVGVSGTGDGDYFLRLASARTVAARMKLNNESVRVAASRVVQDLKLHGGEGGLIALDSQGNGM
ncbi:hypothetical protein M407DRAFT_17019 [Tulasnella calospora MUT 4182]|uniref:Asparaginase n=1 Tax=Tulasnella calospora MUT 4182 TaxID=1051891 RepID=A0A0C3MK71_9AGAM|nr:hypothetical protein M407DRAFT_17019 [Tulasnella calospora MUT 4182]